VPDEDVEYFKPTSGRLMGSLGAIVALAVIAGVAADGLHGSDVAPILGAVFCGVLIWSAMLRPRVGLTQSALVMRNMLSEATIPLAAIDRLGLRTVLAVRAGDRRFVSAAIGRTLRSMRREAGSAPDPVANYADFIEQRIRQRMEDARSRSGIALMSEEQQALAAAVRREWAWVEIAALVVSGVGFVVALLV